MARVLIIGYGNTLCGDDAFGPHVVELLRREGDKPAVALVSVHQLTPELAVAVSKAATVLFLDASLLQQAGTVSLRALKPNPGWSPAFVHRLDPGALLALAASLYGHAPPAYLVTAGGERFEPGSSMSDAMKAALPRALELVESFLDDALAHQGLHSGI